ncbi:helix-turn-helix domain-containing protein [Dactylosporangium sp. CA-152071]|uniref:helix-turn-helix domain-containing protein n=1 Tax=Dactylosporangium sp. CA-152071 TaxID=3239933 RepID=UPI003D925556
MTHQHAAPGPVELVDGSVVVPPHLAGAVRRILVRDLAQHIRTDGGAPTADVRNLVYAFARAEHHHDQDAAGFATETPPAATPKLEISTAAAAALLECSAQHVRSLVRSGRILGRRAGQRAWLIDRASLDAWRYRKDPPHAHTP